MKNTMIQLSIAAFLGSLTFQASAGLIEDRPTVRVERPEKMERPEKVEKIERIEKVERVEKVERPEKVEKPEKIGALDAAYQLARESSEGPRGRDNERLGDRQRRGGRNA